MTGATAHDLCVADLERAHRCLANAKRIGNQAMVARFERRAHRAEHAVRKWQRHPALQARIVPEDCPARGRRFVVRSQVDDRRIASRASLNEAQKLAVEFGFRVVDVTACGVFF